MEVQEGHRGQGDQDDYICYEGGMMSEDLKYTIYGPLIGLVVGLTLIFIYYLTL